MGSLVSTGDVCPCCGRLVSELRDDTGWCDKCSPRISKEEQLERWFHKYGNDLDRLLADGMKITKAVKQVANSIRPVCLCCGKEIRHARSTARFCSKTAQCRKAVRRLRYYKQDLNMPHAEALKRVLESLEKAQT